MIVTTADAAERFLRRFLDTYEARDLDGLWAFYAVDCRFAVLERFGIEPSWAAYKTFMTTFIDAFPDLHHHIDRIVCNGDDVWALYTVTGTHSGPLRGVQPTGKRVEYSIVAMYQVVDGLITRADFVADDLRMLRQLGAVA
ncbi:ester cyclase [Actinomycetes bacterium KLBMP 9759]